MIRREQGRSRQGETHYDEGRRAAVSLPQSSHTNDPAVPEQQTDVANSRLKPLPAVLGESLGADRGLICGFILRSDGAPQELPAEEIAPALVQAATATDLVVWLHFNLSDARARRWLLDASFLPES